MLAHSSLTEPTAVAEVTRYCSWPTQASSYLTGALEIARIRDAFFAARGAAAGDVDTLRDFHDAIAGAGTLPIALAERAALGEGLAPTADRCASAPRFRPSWRRTAPSPTWRTSPPSRTGIRSSSTPERPTGTAARSGAATGCRAVGRWACASGSTT